MRTTLVLKMIRTVQKLMMTVMVTTTMMMRMQESRVEEEFPGQFRS